MSDPHARLKSRKETKERRNKMFVYIVNLTNGQSVRVESAGDPTDHPTFWGRVESVETLGESGKLLHLV
jgi:hypothetical protein